MCSNTTDNVLLPREMFTNFLQNSLISTFLNIAYVIVDVVCPHRHIRACIGTPVSLQAQCVSDRARSVPTQKICRAHTGNKVHIY